MMTRTKDAILTTEISFSVSMSVMLRPMTIKSKAEAINIEANSRLVCENGSRSFPLTGVARPGCGLGEIRTIIPMIKNAYPSN